MTHQQFESGESQRQPFRYDLSQQELQAASSDFLQRAEPLKPSAGFRVYTIDGQSPYADIGRTLERIIFEAAFNNDEEVFNEEYGPYERNSTFFVAFHGKSKSPAGVLRYINNGPQGLKTLNDIAGEPLYLDTQEIINHYNIADLDDCWDVGTLGVLPEYRGKGLKSHWASIMLYRALYVSAKKNDVKHLFTVMDHKAHKGMQVLGIPFEHVLDSPDFSYLGSPSSAALYGRVDDFYPIMDARLTDLKDRHPIKSIPLRRAMGRLMLGNHIDGSIDTTVQA